MTTRTQRIAGSLWALAAFGLLAQEMWELVESRYVLSVGYYVVGWGLYLLAAIKGSELLKIAKSLHTDPDRRRSFQQL